jgi:hypothetical protein
MKISNKIKTGLVIAIGVMLFSGCNAQIIDTTYRFDKAMIRLQDDSVITVDIQSWGDYEGQDQIQIKDTQGKTYLVHSANCTLFSN